MSLYKETDIKLLGEHIDKISEEVKKKKLLLFEPGEQEQRDVSAMILKYIKDHKRKIYGGFALNLLVKSKNPKDAIYKDTDIPDVDFYSPEPILDLIKLCNILHDKGYKYVEGREAMHRETYSIFVNRQLYSDISYVPRNVYNKMPYKEINGLYLIHPNFMTIDYLRMLSDPVNSYLGKVTIERPFKRFYLLQKHHPLPHIEKPLKLPNISKDEDKPIKSLLKTIQTTVSNKETCIIVGLYAYNHFLNESKILESKEKTAKKFQLLEVPYFEIIATDFRNDALNIINSIKSFHPDLSKDIFVEEHYPFFQFLGHSAYVYYKDTLICIIYNHNRRCVPLKKVPAYTFHNGSFDKSDSKINIGTFAITLVYALITVMKVRTDNDDETKDLYHTIVSHLIEMRDYYLNKTNSTIFSDTLFQDFVLNCIGETITPERERHLLIESRKKKNQKYIFSYSPESDKKEAESKYMFANSSGNPVNKQKNLKLSDIATEEDIAGDTDDDTEPQK